MSTEDKNQRLTPARLEAFSDGVLAVIITIMVVELKVPRETGVAGFQATIPILFVYVLSFTFTGIYWVNHHLLIHRIEEVDARVLYSNLLFLFCSSLLPFFTSWVLEKERSSFSVVLYTLSLLATGATFMLLRLAVERRLRRNGQHTADDAATQRKHWLSLGLYLIALPVAFVHPLFAMLFDAAVTLVWILPDLGTKEHRFTPRRHAPSPQSRPSDISAP